MYVVEGRGWDGETVLRTPDFVRCETQPGASAQPLATQPQSQPLSQPHGGSLRANSPANAPPTTSTARAPSVRSTAGGSRPTARNPATIPAAIPAAWRQPAGKEPLPTPRRQPSTARAPSVRNTAGGFRPTAQPHPIAIQPHGGSLVGVISTPTGFRLRRILPIDGVPCCDSGTGER